MMNGRIDMARVQAIAFDPYTHGYYKVTERVGEAFKDGLKLKSKYSLKEAEPPGKRMALPFSVPY